MINFPNELGCWITDGFTNMSPTAKRYLGKKYYVDRNGIINATFMLESLEAQNQLLYWWREQCEYGFNDFSVTLPYFNIDSSQYMVTMLNDLEIVRVTTTHYRAKFTLRLNKNLDQVVILPPPVPVIDLAATDDLAGEVHIAWTVHPGTDKWYLYRDGSILTHSPTNPHVDKTVGAHNYYVVSINNIGTVQSNVDSGYGRTMVTLTCGKSVLCDAFVACT